MAFCRSFLRSFNCRSKSLMSTINFFCFASISAICRSYRMTVLFFPLVSFTRAESFLVKLSSLDDDDDDDNDDDDDDDEDSSMSKSGLKAFILDPAGKAIFLQFFCKNFLENFF